MEFQISHYLIALVIFLVADLLWLGLIAREFYNRQLGTLRSSSTNWVASGAFYLIFNFGLVLFAISPAVEKGALPLALSRGALYGFFTYATYDLTNLATLKDWPGMMSMVDILWGTVLCSTVSGVTFYLVSLIFL